MVNVISVMVEKMNRSGQVGDLTLKNCLQLSNVERWIYKRFVFLVKLVQQIYNEPAPAIAGTTSSCRDAISAS